MKNFTKWTLVLALCISLIPVSQAQIRTYGKFLATSDADAEFLLKSHLSPYMNALGAGMSGGWYTTAKPHKMGGFDLSIQTSVGLVPEEYLSYQLDPADLSYLTTADGQPITTPTIAGENEEGTQMYYEYEGITDSAYLMPPGSGVSTVPVPVIQLGLGLFKGTELVGRYLPQVGVEDKGKLSMWGVGIRHDIKQWIPGIKSLPALHLSLVAGFSQMSSYVLLDASPARMGLDYTVAELDAWEDQRMIATANSFTTNLTASLNLPIINLYGGVGIVYTKGYLLFEGNYPRINSDATNEAGMMIIETQQDPLEFVMDNQDGGFIKPRLNVGVQIKTMKVLRVNIDYSKANYDVVTVGLGIHIR